MKASSAIVAGLAIFCGLLALGGCHLYRGDPRVVGTFRAVDAEEVSISADGAIQYAADQRHESVGLVTIERESPLTVVVIAPDTSPLVGSAFAFSADLKTVVVTWADARASATARPTVFRKVDDLVPARQPDK